jgi:hypothetical protein
MGEERNAYRLLVGSQKERDHQENKDAGGWKILRQILQRHGGVV